MFSKILSAAVLGIEGYILEETIETTNIHSVAGTLPSDMALIAARSFRSHHHTISDAGLIGGGHVPKPGEVSLAHHGILFLDELPEFFKNVLEVMLWFYHFSSFDKRKISSTNYLKHLNREIRRRILVVSIFLCRVSYIRLVITIYCSIQRTG